MIDKYELADSTYKTAWIHRGWWECFTRNLGPFLIWIAANVLRAYCENCKTQTLTKFTYRVDCFDHKVGTHDSQVWCSACCTRVRLTGAYKGTVTYYDS